MANYISRIAQQAVIRCKFYIYQRMLRRTQCPVSHDFPVPLLCVASSLDCPSAIDLAASELVSERNRQEKRSMADRGKEPVSEESRSLDSLWANQECVNRRIDELAAEMQVLHIPEDGNYIRQLLIITFGFAIVAAENTVPCVSQFPCYIALRCFFSRG
ncbi:hypothetical protein M5K25_004539 [Dendrobium thyrsiflorum]|uniref:Uncharacterized protein n=1 Tax=Dendrobium thyrsiflorum TaxID=117978 RepID=A0ABD0VM45_DENTH